MSDNTLSYRSLCRYMFHKSIPVCKPSPLGDYYKLMKNWNMRRTCYQTYAWKWCYLLQQNWFVYLNLVGKPYCWSRLCYKSHMFSIVGKTPANVPPKAQNSNNLLYQCIFFCKIRSLESLTCVQIWLLHHSCKCHPSISSYLELLIHAHK